MRQMELYEAIETVKKRLEADGDRCGKLMKQEIKAGSETNAAYWRGRVVGMIHAAQEIEYILDSWNEEKAKELEEQAAERSEKDCMWKRD